MREDSDSLLKELERLPEKKSYLMVWEGTEATETILRERRVEEVQRSGGEREAG